MAFLWSVSVQGVQSLPQLKGAVSAISSAGKLNVILTIQSKVHLLLLNPWLASNLN